MDIARILMDNNQKIANVQALFCAQGLYSYKPASDKKKRSLPIPSLLATHAFFASAEGAKRDSVKVTEALAKDKPAGKSDKKATKPYSGAGRGGGGRGSSGQPPPTHHGAFSHATPTHHDASSHATAASPSPLVVRNALGYVTHSTRGRGGRGRGSYRGGGGGGGRGRGFARGGKAAGASSST
jgi:hypothetical protein